MGDWNDYYDDHSDGFASKHQSDAEVQSDESGSDHKSLVVGKLVSVHDVVNPWSEIAKIDDVEALIAEFWHLLSLCFSSLRAGSAEFVSSHIKPFVLLLQQLIPFCRDHQLSTMEGYIESVDLLCNSIRHTRAKNLRRKLTQMANSLAATKGERLDYVLAEMEVQQALVLQLGSSTVSYHLTASTACSCEYYAVFRWTCPLIRELSRFSFRYRARW